MSRSATLHQFDDFSKPLDEFPYRRFKFFGPRNAVESLSFARADPARVPPEAGAPSATAIDGFAGFLRSARPELSTYKRAKRQRRPDKTLAFRQNVRNPLKVHKPGGCLINGSSHQRRVRYDSDSRAST